MIPPLLESSARTIGQSLDFIRYQHFQDLKPFPFALSIFSCQEKLSAKIGKLPAASPSTPATPKKNSKVCFCREKIVGLVIQRFTLAIFQTKRLEEQGRSSMGLQFLMGRVLILLWVRAPPLLWLGQNRCQLFRKWQLLPALWRLCR